MFLADSITVMDRVGILCITWLRRATGWGGRAGGVEVFLEWADGLEGICADGFCTVNDDWLPDVEPVFDMCCCVRLGPLVDCLGGVADE